MQNSTKAQEPSQIQIFGAVLPDLMIECVLDNDHPHQLRFEKWDGGKAARVSTTRYRGHTYAPAPIASGLAQTVRFPVASKPFESAPKLCASMLGFLCRYSRLLPDAAALIIAFATASWFADCLPVAPVLYLLGPDNDARLVLRLLGCLCRRPILLGDIDLAALATLPNHLDATLLVDQRNLARRVARVFPAVMRCRGVPDPPTRRASR